MKSPEEIFNDFMCRRRGILRALTQDVEKFYERCDPERENLCLYGNPDSSWEVDLPAEEVPPEMPEPSLGINFARDGMQKRDWLALVAVHSDTWLISVAFYNGARLNKEQRDRLFELINEHPTVYEVVSGRAVASGRNPGQNIRKRPVNGSAKPGMPQQQQPHTLQPPHKIPKLERGPGPAGRAPKYGRGVSDGEDDEEDDLGDQEYGDGEGDPCPNCGRIYKTGDFWIQCDFCDTWYDGKCVQMSPNKAQKQSKWKCPVCVRRHGN